MWITPLPPVALRPGGRVTWLKSQWKLCAYPAQFRVEINTQGLLAALGFWIAGIEPALLLGFLTFVLSFLPGGPPFVWAGVAIWLIVQGDFWWGMFVVAWGALLISTIDNVLRPYLLSQSNDLPVVLGFFGFIGGILAFGFIGIFVGPALLAVGYSLFLEWANTPDEQAEP
nr:AI-2E family transporter [Paracoccus sp. MC1854]